jgi:hypothetical protein
MCFIQDSLFAGNKHAQPDVETYDDHLTNVPESTAPLKGETRNARKSVALGGETPTLDALNVRRVNSGVRQFPLNFAGTNAVIRPTYSGL